MARFLISILLFSTFATSAFARDLNKLYGKDKFQIGTQKFTAFVADDEAKREQGLMFINKIPDDVGMLFVFENQQPLGFWMKNTLIPLAIGFFDNQGILVDVQEMKVANSIMDMNPPSYQSQVPARFALEMNAGWFTRHNIKKGARLTLDGKPASPGLAKLLSLNKNSGH